MGYHKYAWGHDELRPLSNEPFDWYGTPLLMTPVDALDTMIVMGLDKEADEDRQLIDTQLSFDKDIYVKNFEITIRMVGGLLSSYELTHDPKLLALADDLGHAAAARLQLADGHALRVRESEDRGGARREHESG